MRSPDECWPWKGCCSKKGYGQSGICGKQVGAHVRAYEFSYGPVPEGKVVMHSCDNPPCCNPQHLLPGTNGDNIRDAQQKGRLAYGERNGHYTKPESTPRGERVWKAVLTEAKVVEIREQYAANTVPFTHLAAELGMDPSSVSDMIKRRTWKHV